MKSFLLSALLAMPFASATQDYYFPPNSHSKPVAFHVSVNESLIEEARLKARLYRPSVDLQDASTSNEGWLEGPPRDVMTSLAAHWAKDYDWFTVQDEINANWSHYALTVPGSNKYKHPIPLHFVHETSSRKDAIPLLLLHGWPSSHLEWSEVIRPLVSPSSHFDQAFHVVAPDLPGFGFSPAPTHSGLDPIQMGLAFDHLMRALGYAKYGVVTTDLGWWVGMWMTDVVPGSLIGHMTDFWLQSANATDLERFAANETTPEETRYIEAAQAWAAGHNGYSEIQSKNPLALAQALTDSPVGFAGWVWHLVHVASDGYKYTLDQVITRAMMLWIPGTFGNLRAYREFFTVSDVLDCEVEALG